MLLSTYPLFGSDLLKSKRSAITVNATRSARPSSSNRPKCDGPMTICFTGVFNDCNACGLCAPYLFILSATSRILARRKRYFIHIIRLWHILNDKRVEKLKCGELRHCCKLKEFSRTFFFVKCFIYFFRICECFIATSLSLIFHFLIENDTYHLENVSNDNMCSN